jgi:hypothetical protein
LKGVLTALKVGLTALQTVQSLIYHFQSFFPTYPTFCPFARVGTGVELGPLEPAADKGVKVLVFARFAG